MYRQTRFQNPIRHFGRNSKKGELDSNPNGNIYLPRPRIITVSSGKGGVGKTNIVVNLALALGLLERKVLVMDSNLGLGDINILLGKSPPCSINNLLDGDKLLAEILYEGPGGISILPASSESREDVNLDESQKAVFLNEIDLIGDMKEFVLIDTGAGISSNVLFFNLIANDSIVITTPEETAIANAVSLIRVVGLRNPKKHFLILVNLVQNGREAKEIFKKLCKAIDRFSTILSIGFLGYVPYDKYLPLAAQNHRLVLEVFPEAISSRQFREIARGLSKDSKFKQAWGKKRSEFGLFFPAGADSGRG